MSEILDIVNERDEVVGRVEREEAHHKGLTCRMVFVLFYTPEKKIILQRRSMTKKSNPGKLTTTVSGHVSSGDDYDDTAAKETFEEAGVRIIPEKLQSLGVIYAGYVEGDYISNAMRGLYLYEFDGDIDDLRIEAGEGEGFEVMTTDEFWERRSQTPNDFSNYMNDELGTKMVQAIEAL